VLSSFLRHAVNLLMAGDAAAADRRPALPGNLPRVKIDA